MFDLPNLPYAYDALEPVISARTLRIHHDKHHGTYVKTTNELLEQSTEPPGSLEDVIRKSARAGETKLFNNAAQAWNHAFFWLSMTPERQDPKGEIAKAIQQAFDNFDGLKATFVKAGSEHFGSGWIWLTADQTGLLRVRATHDADDTLVDPELTPLLVCDLWEHAYYLDHQNDRKGFLEAWFDRLPNWSFAGFQLAAARGRGEPWSHPASIIGSRQRQVGAR
jgi:Fe-Mn family superoxide dismutase